jgi:acetylornithine/N-succinyldiaminopimelate aminotransferase
LRTEEIMELYDRYVIGNYARNPIAIVRGSGSRVWDAEGREYLDFFPGWGVSAIGHCHPKVVSAIKEQCEKLIHVPNNYYNEPQAILAKRISESSFGGKCFFCNSGAEAIEASIKLARRYFRKVKGEDRFEIITMYGSFHGRTIAAITATAQPKYQEGFEPLLPGFKYIPFNDIDALKDAVDERTCAVLMEPIQGEGGINVAGEDFMMEARRICDRTGALLILDEVQTGIGRTGKMFAYQHYGVVPDIMTLAKALGGGMAIGAIVAKDEISAALTPGSHASTFGGNPLACRAAIAVFDAIYEEGLLERAEKMGNRIKEALISLKERYGAIVDVRGKGLMIGVELDRPGDELVRECMRRGLLINCTAGKVIRFMPSMTVTEEEVEEALSIFEEALRNLK